MSADAWPQDPRRLLHVGHARVRVAAGAGPATPIWRQRIEDALRCAHIGPPKRLVLVRKLHVSGASAQAPGWAGVVEAACQNAVAQACNGRQAGADQAPAVWFQDWDDAVAAWLDAALGWPVQRTNPRAWFWSHIARLAGVAPGPAPAFASSAHQPTPTHRTTDLNPRTIEQVRALWMRWQGDPVSQRASTQWLAKRPQFQVLLQPESKLQGSGLEVDAALRQPGPELEAGRVVGAAARQLPDPVAAVNSQSAAVDPPLPATASRPRADQGVLQSAVRGGESEAAPLRAVSEWIKPADVVVREAVRHDAWLVATHARRGAAPDHPDTAAQPTEPLASAPQQRYESSGNIGPLVPADVDHANGTKQRAAASAVKQQDNVRTAQLEEETFDPAISAWRWSGLRQTELGGLPLTVNAFQLLGFGQALDAIVPLLDEPDRLVAASAPWLAAWAQLSPVARERWVRDPMFAALPLFDELTDLAPEQWASCVLERWRAQAPVVRSLGRQTWRALQRTTQAQGWRSPRALLQRPAWLQLSATHLDVVFALDQAELAVRRLGLDANPGWVPWLGRIVQLHFESIDQLPHRSPP